MCCPDLLAMAQVEQEQRWVGKAWTLGELRFVWRTLVNDNVTLLDYSCNIYTAHYNSPGGHTICVRSMFWAGFMGCAETMAGSMGWPSNSSIESWGKTNIQYHIKMSKKITSYKSTDPDLHEVVRPLHLCHKILHHLLSDQGVSRRNRRC